MPTNNYHMELTAAGLDASSFKAARDNELHGQCPRCGGVDRFVIWTDHQFPAWNWFCRKCHPEVAWLDQLNPRLRTPLTDEQKRAWVEERKRQEVERQRYVDSRLKEFTTAELWAAMHRRMTEDNRQWWRNRGVPDDWQDFLQLGYTPDKPFKVADQLHHSPAYTIPYLRQDEHPVTMQYRLVNPVDVKDKYRFEHGLPAAWYHVTYSMPITDQVVITEGAIKGIVTAVSGGLRENTSILAVPSKTGWAGIAEVVKDCGRVWVILDPDGQADATKLAQEIGKNARIVTMPAKIDDALMGGMTPEQLRSYFRQAREI